MRRAAVVVMAGHAVFWMYLFWLVMFDGDVGLAGIFLCATMALSAALSASSVAKCCSQKPDNVVISSVPGETRTP